MSTSKQIIKDENENLLSFILDIYNDKNTIGQNIRLLRECIFEWHRCEQLIKE